MTHYTRAQWGARPSRGRTSLVASQVEGIALHWPGMQGVRHTVESVMLALRGWQRFHMDDRGWSDLAYQVAIDQSGNSYEIRGLTTRSAANGDTSTNSRFGAILLVLGPGELPSPAMIATTRGQIAKHRALYPNSWRIVGHGQIRAGGTTCPGPLAQGRINAGTFEPPAAAPEPTWPKRVARYLAEQKIHRQGVKREIERLKAARDAARSRGEDLTSYRDALKHARKARRQLGLTREAARKVPQR